MSIPIEAIVAGLDAIIRLAIQLRTQGKEAELEVLLAILEQAKQDLEHQKGEMDTIFSCANCGHPLHRHTSSVGACLDCSCSKYKWKEMG